MRWSWRVARIAGIDVRIHWTFFLLLLWIGGSYLLGGSGVSAALYAIGFVLAIFACVVLHEFGHALAAGRYGIQTQDITLLPIGGVARLRAIPEQPMRELVVAVAGPLVNVVIATLLFVILLLAGGMSAVVPEEITNQSVSAFLANLLWVNVFLVVFNALPAFPMDGGRVLRALLATQMDRVRATDIATSIGQGMAILFGLAGLFWSPWNPILLLIAIFVYLGAGAEAQMVRLKSAVQEVPVTQAMVTRFRTLQADQPLRVARDALLEGAQQDFPVLQGDQLIGVLYRSSLVQGLKEHGPDAPILQAVQRNCPLLQPTDMLHGAMMTMRESGCSAIPVVQDGQILGIVTSENVGELLMLREAERGFSTSTHEEALHA